MIYLDGQGVFQLAPACAVLPLSGPMILLLYSLNIVTVIASGPTLNMCDKTCESNHDISFSWFVAIILFHAFIFIYVLWAGKNTL